MNGKNKSNGPLCAVGHDVIKARIYDFDEMDANHVSAWSKVGGDSSLNNCEILCCSTTGPREIDKTVPVG